MPEDEREGQKKQRKAAGTGQPDLGKLSVAWTFSGDLLSLR